MLVCMPAPVALCPPLHVFLCFIDAFHVYAAVFVYCVVWLSVCSLTN